MVSGINDKKHSPLTYNRYLKVKELKELQVCLSEPVHHDEPLFIIIHQAYELWFKLILHELDTVKNYMVEGYIRKANFYLRRVAEIFKLLVKQIHILETMSPKDFLGFRYNLNPASGFQSSQFREIEFLAGLKDERMLEHFKPDPYAYELLKDRFAKPSLEDHFYDLLRKHGFDIPKDDGSAEQKNACEEQRLQALLKLYQEPDTHAELYDLAELLLDLDELIFLWRVNHVTVVSRIIGHKPGTGGSEGVGYLQSTLSKRAFPDLWKVRTFIQ